MTFSNYCVIIESQNKKKVIGIKKKVTIQDIADALGISRNTVSKAINNTDGLADATRERILQKAVEMGYKQFSYVNTLSGISASDAGTSAQQPRFHGEIALFTTTLLTQSHFAILLLDKFQKELSQLGYTLNTHRVDQENLANMTLPITFVKERVSAIICVEMFNRDYDEMVCKLGLPVLFVDGPTKRSGDSLPADQLYMDNTTGITKLVNEMLLQGKKRIGFIGNYDHCQSFFERYTAFRCAMLMAGVPVDEKFCIKENHYEEIHAAFSSYSELPDLFICANDFVAVDAIRALRNIGKSVPEDVMFCGFDDAPESRVISPALTTVHIHTQIMAFTAAHLLMSRIEEPSLDYRTVHTEANLIRRDSTKF